MKDYRKAVAEIANRRYVICVLLTVLVAYGFAAFNPTISVDDLLVDYYIGSGQNMLGAGRFTMTLLGRLFNYTGSLPPNSYAIDLVAVAAFVWAAVNYCVLFRRICGDRFTDSAAVLFSCALISYPLIIEIWEYTAANLNVTLGYLMSSFALLLVYDFLHGKRDWWYLAAAAVLLMFICAGYESLVVVYIFCVFGILFLQAGWGDPDARKVKTIILRGLCYAAVLLAGLVLKVLVHRLLLVVCGVPAVTNGAREIFWFTRAPGEVLLTMLAGIFSKIFLKSIIYFPITELVLCCVAFFVTGILLCRKRGAGILLPWAGMLLSLFLLPLLQGSGPAYRTCQVYGVFVAFVLALAAMALDNLPFPKVRAAAFFLAGFLCLHQAIYVSHFLSLNHYRSEAENNIVADMGYDLQRYNTQNKPVIFVGSYYLSEDIVEAASIPEASLRWKLYRNINRKLWEITGLEWLNSAANIRQLPETVVQSVISFGEFCPGQISMKSLFSYNGYDYISADCDRYYESAVRFVEENAIPAFPAAGYIADMGECVVIHLG